jgi:NAD(P)-dependent dehydrogenase (short-subunit alcohol dehydrogenase family)
VAVITGGGRGLGRAVALRLAAGGTRVAVLARSAAEVEAVAGEARALGAGALALTADVTSADDIEGARHEIEGKLGPVTAVINNAGTVLYKPFVPLPGRQAPLPGRQAPLPGTQAPLPGRQAPLPGTQAPLPGWAEAITDQEWDDILAVHLGGAVKMLRVFGPGMLERGYGRVVNIASNVVRRVVPYTVGYDTAKGGLVQLTRSLAREWGRYGVTVNAVAAGHFETAMSQPQFDDPRTLRKMLSRVPAGRAGELGEFAALVAFLAGDESGFITGETIGIDGGETL